MSYPTWTFRCACGASPKEQYLRPPTVVICSDCGTSYTFDYHGNMRRITEGDLATLPPVARTVIAIAIREAPLSPDRVAEIKATYLEARA